MMPGRPAAGHTRGVPPTRRIDHPPVPLLPPRLPRRPPGTSLRRGGHPGHSPHTRTRQHLLLDAVCHLRCVTLSLPPPPEGGREGRMPIPLVHPACVKPPHPSRMSERSCFFLFLFFFKPPCRRLSGSAQSLSRLVFLGSTGISFSPRTMVPGVLVALRFVWSHAGHGATTAS